jgi:hypothetical protein
MPRRGIVTPQTPQHIENTQTLKAYNYRNYLEKELDKIVDSSEQADGTFLFTLKTLKLADLYTTQLKQTEATLNLE